jgi:hypothetical protein
LGINIKYLEEVAKMSPAYIKTQHIILLMTILAGCNHPLGILQTSILI